jgi:hypothetical protein
VGFVTQIGGEIVNPWGGDQISHQRVNVYVGADDAVAALPGLPARRRPVDRLCGTGRGQRGGRAHGRVPRDRRRRQ